MKIDIRNIHEVCKPSIHSQILIDIRQKRNWLAHGEKTFVEVGSSSTFSQLKEAKTYVFDFLSEYIKSVENYINNKCYKINV